MTDKEYEFDCKLQDIIEEIYRASELKRLGKHAMADQVKEWLNQQIEEIIEL